MKITIETTDNGFIVSPGFNDMERGDGDGGQAVFQEIDDNEHRALTQVLEHVAQLYFPYDKYSKNNVRITWDKKGHKVE